MTFSLQDSKNSLSWSQLIFYFLLKCSHFFFLVRFFNGFAEIHSVFSRDIETTVRHKNFIHTSVEHCSNTSRGKIYSLSMLMREDERRAIFRAGSSLFFLPMTHFSSTENFFEMKSGEAPPTLVIFTGASLLRKSIT